MKTSPTLCWILQLLCHFSFIRGIVNYLFIPKSPEVGKSSLNLHSNYSFNLNDRVIYKRQQSWELDELVPERVAVCVSGHVARWQPKYLLEGMVLNNKKYKFYLFYNIQGNDASNTSSSLYSTDPSLSFDPSAMSKLKPEESWDFINNLMNTNSSKVVSLVYSLPYNPQEWKVMMKGELDRIRDYVNIQSTILNMYAHQHRCAEQIVEFERRENIRFKYIISTREDIYFFHPIKLSLLESLVSQQSTFQVTDDVTPTSRYCDIPYKACLKFWGFNMRFYFMQRHQALYFLYNRYSYYQYLVASGQSARNPEKFESDQATALGLRGCAVPVENLPATAIRHVEDGSFCFILLEVYNCVPADAQEFVKDKSCQTIFKRRQKLKQKLLQQIPEHH